jgi:hypothetical protein
MPGQRPFIRVANAPSQLPEGGANFNMLLQSNMLDPRADFDVEITFEPLPGCNHALCREQHRTDFHGDSAGRVTVGRGKDRLQQLKMICALLPPKRTCGRWRINTKLILPSLEGDGERIVAKHTHIINHKFRGHPVPKKPNNGGARKN